jgi:hypothetical protein
MSSKPDIADAFDRAIAEIPSCALDEGGVREQRARYARLAPSVRRVERKADAVLIEFREDYDREMLEQTLIIERECCPFFTFELDESARLLRATVRAADQRPALDAMAYALKSVPRVAPQVD